MQNINAYILAGGKSSRMGSEKGLVLLQQKPMIDHIIDEVKAITKSIYIISNTNKYNHYPYPVIKDIVTEKGPLGGIITGLKHSNKTYNLFVSCDIPFVKKELLIELANACNNYEAIVPTQQNVTEPLCGIYHKQCFNALLKLIEQNKLSVTSALYNINTKYFAIDNLDCFQQHMLTSINTPTELKQREESLS